MSTDDSMNHADVANGENPDQVKRQPARRVGNPEHEQPDRAQNPESESGPTGESQAAENRENDPPA